jgi:hypothetical protein
MPEPCPAAPRAANVCTSVSLFEGLLCQLPAGHSGAHASGVRRFTRERTHAHPPAVESVLRLAARALLPCVGGLGGTHRSYTLAGLAQLVRDARRDKYFDVETSVAIESWLAVYEGRGTSDGR